ncbi:MAG: pilin, partial [Lysobacterales bacterium]
STCQEDPTITALSVQNAGYYFDQPTKYVASVNLSGPCTLSVITIVTQNTGAEPSPTLTITGTLGEGNMTFVCASDGPNQHVPRTCRT